MENQETTSGQPLWMLLAIPAFLLVWLGKGGDEFVFRLIYSSLAALIVLALTYSIFVWIPNDQARKMNRKERFKKAHELLRVFRTKVESVEDKSVRENMSRAYNTFNSLVGVLESKEKYQGIIEDKMVPSLEDCITELTEWISNETGDFPINSARKRELYAVLTHKDELFQKWQDDGLDKTGNLTATFRSKMEMEAAGININEGEE